MCLRTRLAGYGKGMVINMKNWCKKVLAWTVTGAIILSLAGCGEASGVGQKDPAESEEALSEYVYVPQFTPISKEGTYPNHVMFCGDRLYYSVNEAGEGDKPGKYRLCYRALDTLDKEETIPVDLPMQAEGKHIVLEAFTVDEAGALYLVLGSIPYKADGEGFNYAKAEKYLCKYDSTGQQVYCQNMKEAFRGQEDMGLITIRNPIVTREGRFYCTSDRMIYGFDENGVREKSIEATEDNIRQLVLTGENKLYVIQASNDRIGESITEVDVVRGKMGTVCEMQKFAVKCLGGEGQSIYVADQEELKVYDPAAQEFTDMLVWTDSGVEIGLMEAFCMEGEDKIRILCIDRIGSAELVTLTKTPRLEIEGKEEIVLGILYSGDSTLQAAVSRFNKTNTKYHVTLKSYIDTSADYDFKAHEDARVRFYADIMGDDAPDIISLDSLDWQNLAKKGFLEDLNPYMEKSKVLSKETLLPSVLAAYEVDGKQITIPRIFSIMTLIGKTSLVGKEPGWTLEELITLADAYPQAALMPHMTESNALSTCLQYNDEAFVDYQMGSCRFDSPQFIKVLEFAKRFKGIKPFSGNTARALKEESLLLQEGFITDVYGYLVNKELFGEECVSIGYPTSDGSAGIYLVGYDMAGISTRSKYKEGAWQFLETLYAAEEGKIFHLSPHKEVMEKVYEDAMTPRYRYDSKGNIMKNEKGEPIQEPKGEFRYESAIVNVYAATAEEIEEIRSVIDMARPVIPANQEIFTIICEEADSYFEGKKEAAEVAEIIQRRVQLYLDENQE